MSSHDKFDNSTNPNRELTSTQRVALITRLLLQGESFTTREVAELCGYSHRVSALHLMERMSAVLPITTEGGEHPYDPQRWYIPKAFIRNGR